jgi:hypothetical protein
MKTARLAAKGALRPIVAPDTAFKLIGLGGIGSIVARYLAVFLGSLREDLRLVLIDGDDFEPANATRMIFPTCGNKAAIVRKDLLPAFEDSRLSVEAIGEYLTPDNIARLLLPGDIVILAVDNHATRKLVSDFCASSRPDIALFSGGNDGIEPGATGSRDRGTFGNVQVFLRRKGCDITPSLTAHHPEIALPADKLPSDLNCTEMIASTPQILFANLAAASAILNALWLFLCGSLHYNEVVFDIGEALMRPAEIIPAGPDAETPVFQNIRM